MDTYSSITNPVDREMMSDLLMMEKHMTETYNSFSNDSTNKNLHEDLLNILNDEHELEFKIYYEIQKRGWCSVEYADQFEIDNIKQKYEKI